MEAAASEVEALRASDCNARSPQDGGGGGGGGVVAGGVVAGREEGEGEKRDKGIDSRGAAEGASFRTNDDNLRAERENLSAEVDSFCPVIHNFRLEDDELVVISEDGVSFRVSRRRLEDRSAFFQALSTSQMRETRERVVNLINISARALKPLIDFCLVDNAEFDVQEQRQQKPHRHRLNGRMEPLHLSLDNWAEIFEAAEFLQIASAVKKCIDFVAEFGGVDQIDDLHQLTSTPRLPLYSARLKGILRRLISLHFEDRQIDDVFRLLPFEEVVAILDSDDVLADEKRIFNVALEWIESDRDNRLCRLFAILENIRFIRGGMELIDAATNHELVRRDPDCVKMIRHQATFYHDYESFKGGRRSQDRGNHDLVILIGGAADGISQKTFSPWDFVERIQIRTEKEVIGGASESLNNVNYSDCWSSPALIDASCVHVHGLCFLAGGQIKKFDPSRIDLVGLDPMAYFTATPKTYLFDQTGAVFIRTNLRHGVGGIELKNMRHPRYSFALLHSSQHVYAIGGRTDPWGRLLSECEGYSIHSGRWEPTTPMPMPRAHHAGVVVHDPISGGDALFVCGGCGCEGCGAECDCCLRGLGCCERGGCECGKNVPTATDIALTWDLEGEWRKMASMPTRRSHHSALFHRGKVVVIGGTDGSDISTPLAPIDAYDPLEDEWIRDFLPPLPIPVVDAQVFLLHGKIHVLGGLTRVSAENASSPTTDSLADGTGSSGGSATNNAYVDAENISDEDDADSASNDWEREWRRKEEEDEREYNNDASRNAAEEFVIKAVASVQVWDEHAGVWLVGDAATWLKEGVVDWKISDVSSNCTLEEVRRWTRGESESSPDALGRAPETRGVPYSPFRSAVVTMKRKDWTENNVSFLSATE